MKRVILQEDVTTLNVYPSNNRWSKFKNPQRRCRNPLLVEDPTPLRHSRTDQKGHGWTERPQESVPFSLPGSWFLSTEVRSRARKYTWASGDGIWTFILLEMLRWSQCEPEICPESVLEFVLPKRPRAVLVFGLAFQNLLQFASYLSINILYSL